MVHKTMTPDQIRGKFYKYLRGSEPYVSSKLLYGELVNSGYDGDLIKSIFDEVYSELSRDERDAVTADKEHFETRHKPEAATKQSTVEPESQSEPVSPDDELYKAVEAALSDKRASAKDVATSFLNQGVPQDKLEEIYRDVLSNMPQDKVKHLYRDTGGKYQDAELYDEQAPNYEDPEVESDVFDESSPEYDVPEESVDQMLKRLDEEADAEEAADKVAIEEFDLQEPEDEPNVKHDTASEETREAVGNKLVEEIIKDKTKGKWQKPSKASNLPLMATLFGSIAAGPVASALDYMGSDNYVGGSGGDPYLKGRNALTGSADVLRKSGTIATTLGANALAKELADKYTPKNASTAQYANIMHDILLNLESGVGSRAISRNRYANVQR